MPVKSSAQQGDGQSTPQQQQGQATPKPQQTGSTTTQKPQIRDWASI